MLSVATLRPDNGDQSAAETPVSYVAHFTVIQPVVIDGDLSTGENYSGAGEIQPTLLKRFARLSSWNVIFIRRRLTEEIAFTHISECLASPGYLE